MNTLPTSLAELQNLHAAGAELEYLLFYGHAPEPDGRIGAGCLSQWWPSPFEMDGQVYATAEHWMMWSKAMVFGDTDSAEQVLAAGHPRQAKALGRQVKRFDAEVWDQKRFAVVVAGNVAKFSQHLDLKTFLVGTQKRVLVEASPTDQVWGSGLAADDERAADPAQWRGRNLLGFALMQAREQVA